MENERTIKAEEISHYASIGPVRGNCGHKHTSPHTAVTCTLRDHRDCRALGGGDSDRQPYLVLTDGAEIYLGWTDA